MLVNYVKYGLLLLTAPKKRFSKSSVEAPFLSGFRKST